jgi:hypothetical protein
MGYGGGEPGELGVIRRRVGEGESLLSPSRRRFCGLRLRVLRFADDCPRDLGLHILGFSADGLRILDRLSPIV